MTTLHRVTEGLHIVVVTGMSGAGRSSALRVLEDLGYFCVDNLPPALAPQLVQLLEGELSRVGFGMDVRTGTFLEGAEQTFTELEALGHETEVIFLDCADDVLVRRFSETRRPHPLAQGADVLAGIKAERERLAALRKRARHRPEQAVEGEQLLARMVLRRHGGYRHRQGKPVGFGSGRAHQQGIKGERFARLCEQRSGSQQERSGK